MADELLQSAHYFGAVYPFGRDSLAPAVSGETPLRKLVVAAIAAVSLAAAGPATAPAQPPVGATVAKSCSSGWKHAVVGGAHKCLRRGQFCARRYDRQYHRYGFHCHRRDVRGNYHLT